MFKIKNIINDFKIIIKKMVSVMVNDTFQIIQDIDTSITFMNVIQISHHTTNFIEGLDFCFIIESGGKTSEIIFDNESNIILNNFENKMFDMGKINLSIFVGFWSGSYGFFNILDIYFLRSINVMKTYNIVERFCLFEKIKLKSKFIKLVKLKIIKNMNDVITEMQSQSLKQQPSDLQLSSQELINEDDKCLKPLIIYLFNGIKRYQLSLNKKIIEPSKVVKNDYEIYFVVTKHKYPDIYSLYAINEARNDAITDAGRGENEKYLSFVDFAKVSTIGQSIELSNKIKNEKKYIAKCFYKLELNGWEIKEIRDYDVTQIKEIISVNQYQKLIK